MHAAAVKAAFVPTTQTREGRATPAIDTARAEKLDTLAVGSVQMPLKAGSSFDQRYWQRMSTLAARPIASSPSVSYLENGEDAFAARLRLIASAKSTIVLSTYAFEQDDYGERLLDALIERAKAGVKVAIRMDLVPQGFVQDEATKERLQAFAQRLDALGKAGGIIFYYAHDAQQNHSLMMGDHLKALIVDGGRAIAGGRNVGKNYFAGDWGDFDLQTAGTIAPQIATKVTETLKRSLYTDRFGGDLDSPSPELRARFDGFMARFQGDVIAEKRSAAAAEQRALECGESPGTPLLFMAFNPVVDKRPRAVSEHPNAITQALIETFERARTEIMISCNYINGGEAITNALVRAAKRGVKVHIMTTSRKQSGRSEIPYLNAQRSYDVLRAAGATLWETYHNEHEKIVVVDREVACTGSYNIELGAEEKLVEQMTWSSDATFVYRLTHKLVSTIAKHTKPYSPAIEKPLTIWQKIFFPFWFVGSKIYDFIAWLMRKLV